jgi:hypothetical protein
MARTQRLGKKVVLYRETVDALVLGYADGQQEVGERIIERVDPGVPDREPYGRGLVQSGAAVTYLKGQKVAGRGTAPRGAQLKRATVMTVVGYGFPGRFLEEGTIYISPGQLGLTQGAMAEVNGAGAVVAPAFARGLAMVRT